MNRLQAALGCLPKRKVDDMAGDAHGDKTQEKPQATQDGGREQAAQGRPRVNGVDWKKAIAERDGRIAKLEAQASPTASTSSCSWRACATCRRRRARCWQATTATWTRSKSRSRGCSRTLLFQSRRAALRDFLMRVPVPTRARRWGAGESSPEWRLRARVVKRARLRRCRHLPREHRQRCGRPTTQWGVRRPPTLPLCRMMSRASTAT